MHLARWTTALRRVRRRPIAALLLVVASATLHGCGGGSPDDAEPSASPPASDGADTARPPADDEEPAGGAAFEGTTGRTAREADGDSVATLTDVRTAERAAGYERVVFEFAGGAVPGYTIEYASSRPAECGSGHPAEVAGDAYLVVRMEPARAHRATGEGQSSTLEQRDRRLGYAAARALALTCDFEATVTFVLGLDRRRPYRAFTLESPARLVVDVLVAREGAAAGEPRASATPSVVAPGGELQVRAAGFPRDIAVEIGFGPPRSEYEVVARARSDAAGRVAASVSVPSWARAGEPYVIVVAGPANRPTAISDTVRVAS